MGLNRFWRDWETWKYNLKLSLGLIYDPNNYPDAPKPDFAPLTPKLTNKTTAVIADDVSYNVRTGKYLRTVNERETNIDADKTDTQTDTIPTKKDLSQTSMAWEILATPTKTDDLNHVRQRELTKADKLLLAERGMDEAKAQIIKAYWQQKKSRRVASEIQMKQSKGYSERIVKDYYAVFNATVLDIESPTLQAK